ncbi:hypothetical protein [Tateyamaria sp. SN6-1]|uniref:hypothetical protein n=1 Tax=Tateyamaria sp. SN6-1 TaxID=3092148 RepID=UPI0039F48BA6
MKDDAEMTDRKDDWIDTLLQDVGDTPAPEVSNDLLMRVRADAEAAMPASGGAPAREPVLQHLLRGLGGWGSLGGLVAATAVGFAVGLGALDGAVLDAYWLDPYGIYYDDSLGLSANGWDLEEG